MTIRVERTNGAGAGEDNGLADQVSGRIRKKLLVRSRVEIVAYGDLPRTEKKSKRVFDNRPSE
jgi:phenylacetate-CoA ligase